MKSTSNIILTNEIRNLMVDLYIQKHTPEKRCAESLITATYTSSSSISFGKCFSITACTDG